MKLSYMIYRLTHYTQYEKYEIIDTLQTRCLGDDCSPNLVFMSILLIFIHVLLKSNSSLSLTLFYW